MTLPPYLNPIDITQDGSDQAIIRAGELARAMTCFTLICEDHGEFAWEVQEKHLEREEERHRNKEQCYRKIEAR